MPAAVSSEMFMYADDTKMYRRSDIAGETDLLQRDLDWLMRWSDKWQLRFNTGKCKVMHIGSRGAKTDYSMAGTNLETTTAERDLGVWVDDTMSSDSHVGYAVSKANQILGLIRRTFTYMDADLMKKLYISLVRPHLEYANVIWHPHLKRQVELLERVQHRATKMVPNLSKLGYEDRLRQMDLPSLVYRRARGDAIEAYKYLHGKYQVDNDGTIPVYEASKPTTRNNGLKLSKRACRTNLRSNFFWNRIVGMWNALPGPVVMAPSVNCFKGRFDRFHAANRYSVTWRDVQERRMDGDGGNSL
jgi:hypothetical protein